MDLNVKCKTIKHLGKKKKRRKSLGPRARQRILRLDKKTRSKKKEKLTIWTLTKFKTIALKVILLRK